MQRIASFSRVSLTRFEHDWLKVSPDISRDRIEEVYNALRLPERATSGSAGYDFFAPLPFVLRPEESIVIPTGIRTKIDEGWLLSLYPRSGLGFKYRMQLSNTVGIIDSDYYYSDNEGHILIKLVNATKQRNTLYIEAGEAFAQGIFLPYGITMTDEATGLRNGGFGSTGSKPKTERN